MLITLTGQRVKLRGYTFSLSALIFQAVNQSFCQVFNKKYNRVILYHQLQPMYKVSNLTFQAFLALCHSL